MDRSEPRVYVKCYENESFLPKGMENFKFLTHFCGIGQLEKYSQSSEGSPNTLDTHHDTTITNKRSRDGTVKQGGQTVEINTPINPKSIVGLQAFSILKQQMTGHFAQAIMVEGIHLDSGETGYRIVDLGTGSSQIEEGKDSPKDPTSQSFKISTSKYDDFTGIINGLTESDIQGGIYVGVKPDDAPLLTDLTTLPTDSDGNNSLLINLN